MKNIVIIALGATLFGCASIDPKPFSGPSGKQGYSMRCSGMGRTLEACYQKAGELCKMGYSIVDRTSSTVAVPVNGSIMAAPQHSLAIECK